jgi:hypothetical protein
LGHLLHKWRVLQTILQMGVINKVKSEDLIMRKEAKASKVVFVFVYYSEADLALSFMQQLPIGIGVTLGLLECTSSRSESVVW